MATLSELTTGYSMAPFQERSRLKKLISAEDIEGTKTLLSKTTHLAFLRERPELLPLACEKCDAIAIELLKHGFHANPTVFDSGVNWQFKWEKRESPLSVAVRLEKLDLTRALLEAGASIYEETNGGFYLFHKMIKLNTKPWFKLVLHYDDVQKFPSFMHRTSERLQACMLATNLTMYNTILAERDPTMLALDSLNEGLSAAISLGGHAQDLSYFVDLGADVNAKVLKGALGEKVPLLIQAIHEEEIPCVEELLRLGADVNVALSNGLTPLQIAISMDNQELVELLLSNDAAVPDEIFEMEQVPEAYKELIAEHIAARLQVGELAAFPS